MATPKDSKIDDVKRPEKVTPSASGRPLLISNEPTVQTDPMMAPPADQKKDDSFAMSHTGKEIKPLDPNLQPKSDEDDTPDETSAPEETEVVEAAEAKEVPEETEPKPEKVTPDKPEEAGPEKTASAEPVKPEVTVTEKPEKVEGKTGEPIKDVVPPSEKRDPEAAQSAEEAAKEEAVKKREKEIEDLIASGKYEVPINAVQRKRSRTDTILLSILAVILLLVLVDAALDVGIVKVPSSIPHTHYFSK